MRLITHNLLACHARTCTQTSNNFPLRFEQITKLELIEADFNEAFVRGFLPKVDWDALVSAARSLGSDVGEGLPKAAPDLDDPMLDQELLKKVHHVLLEVSLGWAWREQATWADDLTLGTTFEQMHIVEGQMLCPNCSHVFQIRNGIPNMVSEISLSLHLRARGPRTDTIFNTLAAAPRRARAGAVTAPGNIDERQNDICTFIHACGNLTSTQADDKGSKLGQEQMHSERRDKYI